MGGRFPGFDALSQSKRWDAVTAGVVLSRLGPPPAVRFFTPAEQAVATALLDRLLGAHQDVPVLQMIGTRLANQETDGWRYEDMPEDGQAWRDSLTYLDADAQARFGHGFAACPADHQAELVQAVQDLDSKDWHGLQAARVWSLWTRYACTAFYSHPAAWDEIGFPGPAYPRGYKNLGVDAREPFEVRDAEPSDDPMRKGI
ncbi:MAG: gluconate 2-dehydrogenase subunit 3 family protein [Actinoallomurus sp.]